MTSEPIRLDGKGIVITGAGRGLGAAYARHIAELGGGVIVNDVDERSAHEVARDIREAGGAAVALAASVADPDAGRVLVQECIAHFGQLDGLVNNAGVFGCASIEQDHDGLVGPMLAVNITGTITVGLAAARVMLEQGHGSIVNITSGTQSGAPGLAAYAASKGAIASLTYSWAMECAGRGVRVNAFSPNAETQMARTFEAWRGAASTGQNLGKRPEDNAPVVSWLLSDGSRDVNGQVLRLDGDALSLVTHPRPGMPVSAPAWTPEAIAAAVRAGALGPWQQLGAIATQGD